MREGVPFFPATLQQGRTILGQNPALMNEFVGGTSELSQVGLAIRIALGDRLAWVVRLLTRRGIFRKWDVRPLHGNALRWPADRGIAKVPSRVGCERHRDLGQ